MFFKKMMKFIMLSACILGLGACALSPNGVAGGGGYFRAVPLPEGSQESRSVAAETARRFNDAGVQSMDNMYQCPAGQYRTGSDYQSRTTVDQRREFGVRLFGNGRQNTTTVRNRTEGFTSCSFPDGN